jgi:hypothetical protein
LVPLARDDRFRYRVRAGSGPGVVENPLNNRAGALTHASDKNERAAISINKNKSRQNANVVMHTLTAGGDRKSGATMEQWQAITDIGARTAQNSYGSPVGSSTLNLDGGGSVFMGVRKSESVKTVARGGPVTQAIRAVANIIASRATDPQLRKPYEAVTLFGVRSRL